MIINNELLAAYAEDNVSQEEREAVRQYLAENPDKMESVLFAIDLGHVNIGTIGHEDDRYLDNLDTMVSKIEGNIHKPEANIAAHSFLSMKAMAAENVIDRLCVVRCEGVALRHFGLDVTDEQLIEESKRKGWLKSEGTALHNIGRLSGERGLSVSHRYNCSLDDIRASLSANNVVIAAVDGNELTGNYAEEQDKDVKHGMAANHVVIVNIITEDSVIVTDSATPTEMDVYALPQFLDAWEDSGNYLTVISNSCEYTPHPIKLDDVAVEDELLELQEAIAENAHEVWAETRRNEGWTYGPFRDDEKKQNPDMIPYNLLPESEKEYDRLMAMNTIKLVKKLGWAFTKKDTTVKKVRSSSTAVQTDYTEIELCAITTIILKILCADKKIVSTELATRGKIYKQFGITYQHEQRLLSFREAVDTYKNMSEAKREKVKSALHEIALADGTSSEVELKFIEKLDK